MTKSKPKILKKKDYEMIKAIESVRIIDASERPYATYDYYGNYYGYAPYGLQVNMYDLWELSRYSDIFTTVLGALRRKVFKGGIEIKPLVPTADEAQKSKMEEFSFRCNENGQSLTEVFGELEDDLNVFDESYMLVLKDYFISEANTIIGGDVQEVIRVFPLNVLRVMDGSERLGYKEGKKQYFEIEDRKTLTDDPFNAEGIPNMAAHYRLLTQKGDMHYNKSEILNKQKFRPSKTGGFSPMYGLYNKGFTLIAQDYYIRTNYESEKPSKQMVFLKSSNLDSLKAEIKDWRAKVKDKPHGFYPIGVEAVKDSGDIAEVVDFMRSLEELQFTSFREESRNAIGAVYGVSPIFQNDLSTSGGLNNEGLQITVTNEAIESDQDIFNLNHLPFVFNFNMGITDWEAVLMPNEEEDLVMEKDLMTKSLANAKAYLELGGSVRMDENGEFIFEKAELKQAEAASFTPTAFAMETKGSVEKPSSVVKAVSNKFPTKEIKQFETKLDKELKQIIKKLNLKKKPTEAQLKKIVKDISKNLDSQLKAKSANRVRSIYEKSVKATNKELREDFKLTDTDRAAINNLKRSDTFKGAFADLGDRMQKNLTKTVTAAFEKPGFELDKLVGDLKEELGTANGDLQRIARTESTKISVNARKNAYEKTGKFDEMKFKHIGPDDSRTGEDSKLIKKKVKDQGKGDGVSWDSYVKIIEDVAAQFSPTWKVDPNAPIPRPNTRHVPVRAV